MTSCDCTTDIVVIADRSGSMASIIDDAIGGFNTFLAEQKGVEGKATLSLALFDHEYTLVHDCVDIQSAPPLDSSTYAPRGATALYDAIGFSLANLKNRNPKKAVLCIITDGAENSSREYNRDLVVQGIKEAEEKGWQVVYLAANQDAFQVGGSLGVSKAGCMNFAADGKDLTRAYTDVSMSTSNYRAS